MAGDPDASLFTTVLEEVEGVDVVVVVVDVDEVLSDTSIFTSVLMSGLTSSVEVGMGDCGSVFTFELQDDKDVSVLGVCKPKTEEASVEGVEVGCVEIWLALLVGRHEFIT